MPRPVAFLSDFGTGDFYAGVIRAVVASSAPSSTLIDISHDLDAHDVDQASFVLSHAMGFLPGDTVVVVVVDPGVGTVRRGLVIEMAGRTLVGPDNGFASDLLAAGVDATFYCIDEELAARVTQRRVRGATFHGRDVFAPVAAALAGGIPASEVGDEVDAVVMLRDVPSVSFESGRVTGTGRYVDRFGNILSDIPRVAAERIAPSGACRVSVGGVDAGPLRRTYGDAAPGEFLALLNSWDQVEAAVRDGRAADRFPGLPPRRIGFELAAA